MFSIIDRITLLCCLNMYCYSCDYSSLCSSSTFMSQPSSSYPLGITISWFPLFICSSAGLITWKVLLVFKIYSINASWTQIFHFKFVFVLYIYVYLMFPSIYLHYMPFYYGSFLIYQFQFFKFSLYVFYFAAIFCVSFFIGYCLIIGHGGFLTLFLPASVRRLVHPLPLILPLSLRTILVILLQSVQLPLPWVFMCFRIGRWLLHYLYVGLFANFLRPASPYTPEALQPLVFLFLLPLKSCVLVLLPFFIFTVFFAQVNPVFIVYYYLFTGKVRCVVG